MPLVRSACLLVLGACCALAAVASAAPPESPLRADFSRAVPDAELLLAVDGAAEARGTPVGRVVADVVDTLLASGRAERAWNDLASRLGWTPQETFDALLGRRAVLIVRGLSEPRPQWALLSDVPADAERRLRERLAVAPRSIVRGHAVMALERGDFELTSERHGERAVLLLAPTGGPTLFDDLIPLLRPGPDAEAHAESPMAVGPIADPRLILFQRDPRRPEDWIGVVARVAGSEARATILTSPNAALARRGMPRAVWSDDRWRALLTPDTFLAVSLFVDPTLDAQAQTPMLRALSARFGPSVPAGEKEGAECTVLARRVDGARLDVALAMQVCTLPESIHQIDAQMAGVLAVLGLPGQDYTGLPSDAERDAIWPQPAPPGPASVIAGSRVRWTFCADADPAPRASPRGWWITGSGGTAFDHLRAGVLEPPAPAQGPVVISRGHIRPAMLVDVMGSAGLPVPQVARAAIGVDTVTWSLRQTDSGALLGEATLRAAPAPDAGR